MPLPFSHYSLPQGCSWGIMASLFTRWLLVQNFFRKIFCDPCPLCQVTMSSISLALMRYGPTLIDTLHHAYNWKGKGHQGIFSLVKGTLMYEEIVNFYCSISRAPRQWPGGMEAITFVASSEVSGLMCYTISWTCTIHVGQRPFPFPACGILIISRAPRQKTRGHGGNHLRCLSEVSGLMYYTIPWTCTMHVGQQPFPSSTCGVLVISRALGKIRGHGGNHLCCLRGRIRPDVFYNPMNMYNACWATTFSLLYLWRPRHLFLESEECTSR